VDVLVITIARSECLPEALCDFVSAIASHVCGRSAWPGPSDLAVAAASGVAGSTADVHRSYAIVKCERYRPDIAADFSNVVASGVTTSAMPGTGGKKLNGAPVLSPSFPFIFLLCFSFPFSPLHLRSH